MSLQTEKQDYDKARAAARDAQERYEKAKARHLPPVERAKNLRDKARAKVRAEHKQLVRARAQAATRVQPERTKISPNRSSRGGVDPRLIVLHITVSHNRPGLADLDGILSFFDQPSSGVSSHIVNDREGHDARCVSDAEKAWTQAAYNPQALSIEQIEYSAGRTREQWLTESRKQLENTALWIAHWSKTYDIPITHSTSRGVCRHSDLGAAGGGHSDPGSGYPLDWVLDRARTLRRALG